MGSGNPDTLFQKTEQTSFFGGGGGEVNKEHPWSSNTTLVFYLRTSLTFQNSQH